MAWNITSQFLEACSCNVLCPCWYGVQELMVMDQGWCDSIWLFRVGEGNSEGVDLSGRTIAAALAFPGPTLFDGNGTARLYIDDAATDDQRRELEAIFHGEKGGPLEIIAGLVTKWLPTKSPKIEVQEQNGTLTADVAGFGVLNSQRMTNETGQPTTMANTGFTTAFQFDNLTAQLAPSGGSRWTDPDMPRSIETRSGVVANFTWSGS